MWHDQRSLAAALNEARMIRNPSFAEILDDLAAESEPGVGSRAGRFSGVSGGEWAFSAFGKERDTAEPDRRAFEAAFFQDTEDCEIRAPDFDLDEGKIARELGLAAATSLSDLTRARRAFALRNHPDVVDPRFRSRANERMQIANMLLDRRNREIRAAHGSRTR
ncbi:MAG: hypothetical protein EPN75_11755 [Beijerinckiaceae bacterium]|nr:MAG: hypothetical protein EPN75_11755 [Beijerinckiaceae bacterium]